jgi:hypothetical protein
LFFQPPKKNRGIAVFYRPNYCCHCGEKIERVKWTFTASRRFCEICQTDFVLQDWLPRIFVAIAAVCGVFGVGAYLGKESKPPEILSKQLLAANSNLNKVSADQLPAAQVSPNSNIQQSGQANISAGNRQLTRTEQNLPNETFNNQREVSPVTAAEPVYYCGAETKKGTPCSRRVKGGGRCWQHKGQTAMLPPEKLLVGQ